MTRQQLYNQAVPKARQEWARVHSPTKSPATDRAIRYYFKVIKRGH